jgi:hypothetical protein
VDIIISRQVQIDERISEKELLHANIKKNENENTQRQHTRTLRHNVKTKCKNLWSV